MDGEQRRLEDWHQRRDFGAATEHGHQEAERRDERSKAEDNLTPSDGEQQYGPRHEEHGLGAVAHGYVAAEPPAEGELQGDIGKEKEGKSF